MRTLSLFILFSFVLSQNISREIRHPDFSHKVKVLHSELRATTAIQEVVDDDKLIIFPNPATTEINLEFSAKNSSHAIISIENMDGRKLVVIPVSGKMTIPCNWIEDL